MYKIFFTIAGTAVVLNVYLLLVPNGKYEKYVGFVAGLLIMLITMQTVFNQEVNISFGNLNFDESFTFENSAVSRVALEQWIEGIAEGNLSSKVQVRVKKQGDVIRCIELYAESELKESEIL